MGRIIKTAVPFPDGARLVSPPGEASEARYIFIGEITLESKPQTATMILVGSDFFDVMINGVPVAEYAIRSYVFCRAYEAYDVSDLMICGKNEVRVRYADSKTPSFRGFVCEFLVNETHKNIQFWYYGKDRSHTYVSHFVGRGGAEIFDTRLAPRVNMIKYGDGYVEAKPLVLADGTSLYQSLQSELEKNTLYPQRISVDGHFLPPSGELFTFETGGAAVLCAKCFSGVGSVEMTNVAGVHSFYIDEAEVASGEAAELSAGEHTVKAFTRGGVCSFTVKVVGAKLGEWREVFCAEPKAERGYPWNDIIQEYKICDATLDKIKNAGAAGTSFQDVKLAERGYSPFHEIKSLVFSSGGKFDLPNASRGKTINLAADGARRRLVADFGRESVGMLKIEFETDVCAEIAFFTYELTRESEPRLMGERSCGKIISHGGKTLFVSDAVRGLRYVCLILPPNVEIKNLRVSLEETRYNVSDVGAFVSSDKRIDAVYDMSVRTAAVCMLDSYVDCPGYEQNIWTGDARITGEINMLSFGEREYDARYLDTVAQSMSAGLRTYYRGSNPLYVSDTYLPCACFPTYPDGGIPIWSFSWVLHTLEHYMRFGDDGRFERRLMAAEECLRRAEAHMSSRGLFAPLGAWNLIDWADNDLSPYGEVSANNMMLCACYTNVSNVLHSLGKSEKADEYSKKADTLKEKINLYCFSAERGAYVDTVRDKAGYELYLDFCKFKGREAAPYDVYRSAERISVQTATFALLYDIAEGERKKACEKLLLDDVERGNFRAGTPARRTYGNPSESEAPGGIVRIGTPFFMYYALGALFKLGRHAEALDVILREWGGMLDDGINTCVEAFRDENGEWGRSMAHAWSAAPAIYLKTEILGIKPLEAGYKKFTVEPYTRALSHAEGAVYTPHGPISVSWRTENGKTHIRVDAPSECERV